MKLLGHACLLVALTVLSSSCSLFQAKKAPGQQTILEVGNQQVNSNEFQYVYEKNNQSDSNLYSEESLTGYADLYTDFKLKVEAAKDAGLDTLSKLQREFRTYQEQLANPYLQSDSVMEQLLKEAYQRRLQEVQARHISVRLPRGAPEKDTAKAYKLLNKIRQKAKTGQPFQSLAQTYQDRVSAGKLGYFSVFDQPYPVEHVAYALAPGEVSQPIRSDFGYHLIKVTDKRPYQGKIQGKHIMIKPQETSEASGEQPSAKARIDSLYRLLQNGAEFSRLARQYSDDQRSSRKGGDLPAFDRSNPNFPRKFKQKAFTLQEDGAISKPFQTRYGYHILKRESINKPDSFEAMKPKLKQRLKQSNRYELVQEAVAERIKRKGDYQRLSQDFGPLQAQLDSTFKTGNWRIKDKAPLKTNLFRIEDTAYQLLDLARYIEKQDRQKLGQYQYRSYALEALFEEFEQQRLLAYERAHLTEKYPEYRHLLKEYKEGILLFEIMDRKVWSKAVEDSAKLRSYYQQHRDQYQLPLSKAVTYYRFPSKRGQQKAYAKLESGEAHRVVKQNLRNQLQNDQWVQRKDTFRKGQQAFMAQTPDEPGLYRYAFKGQHYVVEVEDVIPGGRAPFERVRGQVVADYQDQLEEQWLSSLRERYQVVLHQDVLESLVRAE